MITATALEFGMLLLLAGSHEPRTRIIGLVLWTVYLRYSATRALIGRLLQWLDDRNNPPGAGGVA